VNAFFSRLGVAAIVGALTGGCSDASDNGLTASATVKLSPARPYAAKMPGPGFSEPVLPYRGGEATAETGRSTPRI
jgi:hypothetical protein